MTPRAVLAPGRLAGRPVLRTQTDERLVDLVRAGSESAFEAIVARYRRPLLRYCSRILSEERAEDAVQQTFMRAYGAMRKNGAELSLKPWLYRIAHNTALNALRDRGLRHEELPDQLDGIERPDEALQRSQDLRAVLSAVQDLPERQRNAIVRRELEGRSYEEIADELGVTDGAVRQLLNRARNTLREAATALTPGWLLARLPFGGAGEPVAARVAELCGAGSGGAAAAKVCATALVTGAVVSGGVAVGPDVLPGSGRGERPAAREGRAADPDVPAPARVAPEAAAPAPAVAPRPVERADGSGGGEDGSGSSGSGSGSSGSNSGPGSGSSGSGSDSSGSGSSGSGSTDSDSGSGSSDSGSGSSSSGSGSSGSGTDSGSSVSSSSGSGTGGSDSGQESDSSGSGSGSSGSDSSGSGSSGSEY
jgi:RNA polymerase sigma factor (sigma-70 family)